MHKILVRNDQDEIIEESGESIPGLMIYVYFAVSFDETQIFSPEKMPPRSVIRRKFAVSKFFTEESLVFSSVRKMNLSGNSETYQAALEERRAKEMVEVEEWIDSTQLELYRLINKDGRRRSSFLMSEECMEHISNITRKV